jgi:chemotaxis signal transduction protein
MSTMKPPTHDSTAVRLIITRTADLTLAFPTAWVSEIFQADRKQVLPMPFYSALVLGVLHHNSQVVPLIVGDRLFGNLSAPLKETLTIIQLSRAAGALAGIGIVVEQLLGSNQTHEIDAARSTNSTATVTTDQTIVFNAALIPEILWQPQRWKMHS